MKYGSSESEYLRIFIAKFTIKYNFHSWSVNVLVQIMWLSMVILHDMVLKSFQIIHQVQEIDIKSNILLGHEISHFKVSFHCILSYVRNKLKPQYLVHTCSLLVQVTITPVGSIDESETCCSQQLSYC